MIDVHPGDSVSELSFEPTVFRGEVPLPVTEDALQAAADGQPYSESDVVDAVSLHQHSLHIGDGSPEVAASLMRRNDTVGLALDDSCAFFAVPSDIWEFESDRLSLSGPETAGIIRAYRETAQEYDVSASSEREVFAVGYGYPIASIIEAGVNRPFATIQTAEQIFRRDVSVNRRELTLYLVNKRYTRDVTDRVGESVYDLGPDEVSEGLDRMRSRVSRYRMMLGDDSDGDIESFFRIGSAE